MFTFSSKGSSHSRMQAQIPHSARCSKYRKCSVSPVVATVPETSTSVESLHTAEYTEKINALIHSTRNPLKRKSINIIHHFRSVQTGIFRSVASLNWKFVPFSRKRRHTFLHGLQTFNMSEIYINRTDVTNSFDEGSDTQIRTYKLPKRPSQVLSFIINCECKKITSHQYMRSVSFTLVIEQCACNFLLAAEVWNTENVASSPTWQLSWTDSIV